MRGDSEPPPGKSPEALREARRSPKQRQDMSPELPSESTMAVKSWREASRNLLLTGRLPAGSVRARGLAGAWGRAERCRLRCAWRSFRGAGGQSTVAGWPQEKGCRRARGVQSWEG